MATLSLVIPGLWGPPALRHQPALWAGLSLPALEQIASRARRGATTAHDVERLLCELVGCALPEGDVPVAAVTRQWEAGDAGEDWWLRADPVHLLADRDRIVMAGNAPLVLSVEECRAFAAELNAHFTADGWDLRAPNAQRWYLRLPRAPRLRTVPLPETVGQDVLHHLPEGEDAAHWRSLLNEAQMVLHGSAVNREREARGEPPVNSLWFWGGGRLPPPPPPMWSQVWSNAAFVKGLAALSTTPCASLPENAHEWLAHDTQGRQLLVIEALREHVQHDEPSAWRESVTVVYEEWLAPLWAALRRRRLDALELHGGDGVVFRLTARDARRWWVRRRPLGAG